MYLKGFYTKHFNPKKSDFITEIAFLFSLINYRLKETPAIKAN